MKDMDNLERISITLPSSLLVKLNTLVQEGIYPNRSKAVQEALNISISEHEWNIQQKGLRTGLIAVLYDHKTKELEEALTETQHHDRETIIATMHIHLTEAHCLQTIIVKGQVSNIITLLNNLKKLKGVKQTKLLAI
jgi:CopG family nickel-responsive transcriptional regulator